MQAEGNALAVSNDGVVILRGWGVKAYCRHHQLVLEDGVGRDRRRLVVARASGLKRLVIDSTRAGSVTLEAMGFLRDVKAQLLVIDRDGEVLATTATPGLDDPRLRLAQASAVGTPVALEIGRFLIGEKIARQADVLEASDVGGTREESLRQFEMAAGTAPTMRALQKVEQRAASEYFASLSSRRVVFARNDQRLVPEAWLSVGTRSSPLTSSPRRAVTPVQAAFNLGHSIAAAESRIACLAAGLDPGIGFVHTTQVAKDALCYDVQEAVRGLVEGHVLRVLDRPLQRRFFRELPTGEVRILPRLRDEVAALGPLLATELASIVEHVAQLIADSAGLGRLATNLSGSKRSKGRDGVRKHEPKPRGPSAPKPKACRGCGVILEGTEARWCEDCLPDVLAEGVDKLSKAGPAALAMLRAQGRDAAQTPEAKAKRRATSAITRAADRAWESAHPERQDPSVFTSEILPKIESVSLPQLSRATGLSTGQCGAIRSGRKVPHERHWAVLASIGM